MTTYHTLNPENIHQSKVEPAQILQGRVTQTENRQLWFFLGVAPLAVLIGWSLVAVCLTGDWAWELPLGLVFAVVGSMSAIASRWLKL